MDKRPTAELPGVGPKIAAALSRLGIETVTDLLSYLPSRLEDRSQLRPIGQLRPAEDAVIEAEIVRVSSRQSRQGRLIIQARVRDQSGEINALWFNQRYLLGLLKPGHHYYLYGQKRLNRPLGHPFFVKKIITEPEIAPIYRTLKGLPQTQWRRLFRSLRLELKDLAEPLPAELLLAEDLPKLADCLTQAHFPEQVNALARAQRRLGFDELLRLALQVSQSRQERQRLRAKPIPIDDEFLRQFVAGLPFRLTAGQRRSAWILLQDLARSFPMRRLLFGEVGSGKTAVAAIAAVAVIRHGGRVVMLSPTTALAEQHYQTFQQLLDTQGTVGLLTSARQEAVESANIVVATHAAFHQAVKLSGAELIIIDEQQRFGVDERQRLLSEWPHCHVLMLTATPIPRSLAQTIFGSLDVTYLTDKPAHQQKVETKIFTASSRAAVEEEIAARLRVGEPGYVICPLIEEPGDELVDLLQLERKSVLGEARRLKQRFPAARIGIASGRLKDAAKERVVHDFRQGRIDILVATTVVEVGIDNPLASWILIEEADRFGLAQLHQLRGRVGRGDRPSICFLSQSLSTPGGAQRLRTVASTTDGLALSEADLRLRGPGELTGLNQSGLPNLRYADWSDAALIRRVFAYAEKLLGDGLAKYPELADALSNDGRQESQTGSGAGSLL